VRILFKVHENLTINSLSIEGKVFPHYGVNMIVKEFESKLQSTYPFCCRERQELQQLINEYQEICRSYEETSDSKKMIARAYELLADGKTELSKIITLMRLAVKIIKTCNGLRTWTKQSVSTP
jgi:hypothetical protein